MRPLCLPKVPWRVQIPAFPRRLTAPRSLTSSRPLRSIATADCEPPLPEPLLPHARRPLERLPQPTSSTDFRSPSSNLAPSAKNLPISCPGCGALTQDVDPGLAGFYTLSRKAVRKYTRGLKYEARQDNEHDKGEEIVEECPVQIPENSSSVER